ncbi:uncharacterized protein BO80DRAFT_215516 [Aspergillus ibericus CBS 121593]|uniref:4Fe-4S ferredoxin-type domain-containing protein n=1 Tax=Aspergillus ibericus CBS 121593 TaxID=1448316 RepID=A0A395GS63_9EURO|nr:hypothetical protein BO80DRAFT_215516 [Aspergillus ibericus CBS 121593]RAK96923.1 hypothetical protein BO80DRAFT_215516 [Aspergillus ibericus CBS 121593]
MVWLACLPAWIVVQSDFPVAPIRSHPNSFLGAASPSPRRGRPLEKVKTNDAVRIQPAKSKNATPPGVDLACCTACTVTQECDRADSPSSPCPQLPSDGINLNPLPFPFSPAPNMGFVRRDLPFGRRCARLSSGDFPDSARLSERLSTLTFPPRCDTVATADTHRSSSYLD